MIKKGSNQNNFALHTYKDICFIKYLCHDSLVVGIDYTIYNYARYKTLQFEDMYQIFIPFLFSSNIDTS